MQNVRFIPPLNLDRALFAYDSPTLTGKNFSGDAKYLDDRHCVSGSRLNFRGLSTAASSLSLVSPVDVSPMSAPPRSSGTELSSMHFAGKSRQLKNPKKFWKLFTGKSKVDELRSANLPSRSTTACDSISVKKHKSTPNLKGLMNANLRYPPCQEFPPSPGTEYFVRTSSDRALTDHPTIILVVDDNWDSSSTEFPLKRVDQIVPMDITAQESSECLDAHSRRAQPFHPTRAQRPRADTSKSSRERCFKTYTRDPNASFLIMDETAKFKRFWI